MTLFIIGCSKNAMVRKDELSLYFIGTNNLALELKTTDGFNSANLTNSSGEIHRLFIDPRAKRGLLMSNEEGTSIYVKGTRATLIIQNKEPVEVITLLM